MLFDFQGELLDKFSNIRPLLPDRSHPQTTEEVINEQGR